MLRLDLQTIARYSLYVCFRLQGRETAWRQQHSSLPAAPASTLQPTPHVNTARSDKDGRPLLSLHLPQQGWEDTTVLQEDETSGEATD